MVQCPGHAHPHHRHRRVILASVPMVMLPFNRFHPPCSVSDSVRWGEVKDTAPTCFTCSSSSLKNINHSSPAGRFSSILLMNFMRISVTLSPLRVSWANRTSTAICTWDPRGEGGGGTGAKWALRKGARGYRDGMLVQAKCALQLNAWVVMIWGFKCLRFAYDWIGWLIASSITWL